MPAQTPYLKRRKYLKKKWRMDVCAIFTFMLDLSVAMNRILFALSLVISLVFGSPFQQTQQVVVDAPKPGEALQGKVTINGTIPADGFKSYDVSFSFQHDTTNTWFLISQGNDAVQAGALAEWDTTTISDGTYRIRVTVFLKDGRAVQTMITGLRVRNYTTVETSTPAPVLPEGTLTLPTLSAVDYSPLGSTATPLAGNPAQVSAVQLGDSLVKGGLVALALFVLVGLYLLVRGLFRRG